jgi:hypothetical protein
MPDDSITSEQKKQANRENSKHSTGPKTSAGKNWSRLNALQHGFYATEVVIRQGDGRESAEEFKILHEGLRRAWRPKGMMQERLVATIAECEWRLQRAMRAEVGEICRYTDSYLARQSLDALREEELLGCSFSMEEGGEERGSRTAFWSGREVKQDVRKIRPGIERRLSLLALVREAIQGSGRVSEELQKKLDAEYGQDYFLARMCNEVSQLVRLQQLDETKLSSNCEEAGLPAGGELVELKKQTCLKLIDHQIGSLEKLHTDLHQAEHFEHQATLSAYNLPSKEFLDKLVRYESMLEKRKQNAIKTLLMLQKKQN